MMVITRRSFLEVSASGLAMAAGAARVNATPQLSANPFTLGVASGDPLSDRVVIWTRLALAPLELGGGMAPESLPVQWEVALDESFSRIVRSGRVNASPANGHAVHVDVAGLAAHTHYWYRFRLGSWESGIGRTRTAAAASLDALKLAFVSCQRWEQGLFTAYKHLSAEDLDLVFHLGDYIYEYGPPEKAVRPIVGPEIVTLDDYRRRYAQYRTDAWLQAAHAAAPFVTTWDDHEVDNDYAGDRPEDTQPRDVFLERRAAAYRAYYENMPLRRAQAPAGSDLRLYRSLRFGRLAEFQVLDTRQYRTKQPCGGGRAAVCDGARAAAGTILGNAQERWLLDRLSRSTANWNVLAQQVPITLIDGAPGPPIEVSMDKWGGYQDDRRALLEFIERRKPSNPVVLTGDVHANWVCDVKPDAWTPGSPTLATEFVGTSISSGGDGEDVPERVAAYLPDNPHVRFFNGQRGYVRCTVSRERWQSDYRIVPFVTRPDAPVETRASFVVESGRPGAQRA
jgi:alkaline phosphatase D